ncbi:MAG: hypothetical protein CMP47_15975 [Rickettsiales bacterium]|nr:hypothetical protein [Rickettsiales bacterium]
MPIMVEGLGIVPTELTSTDSEVVDEYRKHFEVIEAVFGKDPTTITAADAAALGEAMQAMKDLAANGLNVTTTDANGDPIQRVMYVTRDMARQIDLLARSMSAAGITGTPDVTGVRRWQDLGVEGVDLVVGRAELAIDHNRSLQALVELEYVRTGNEVLADQLDSLYEALSVTKGVTETLTELQDLRNLLEPDPERIGAGDIDDLLTDPDDLDASVEEYNTISEELFKDPIDPVVDYRGRNPQDVIADLDRIRGDLAEQLAELDKLNPPQIDEFGQAVRGDGSLADKINTVLEDMNQFFAVDGDGNEDISQVELEAWLIDNLDKHIDEDDPELANAAGDVQRHVQQAIQAATNLNDQQKEDFRRFMFVFEEFYKSASAILNRLNQLIEKMAQNAGR